MANVRGNFKGIQMRRLLLRGLIALALLMTFRTFPFFPGMQHVQEAWFLLCFLIVLFVNRLWKTQVGPWKLPGCLSRFFRMEVG